jgi:hypothetical protein
MLRTGSPIADVAMVVPTLLLVQSAAVITASDPALRRVSPAGDGA